MRLGLGLRIGNTRVSTTIPGILDNYPGAVTALSLRYLTTTYTGDVILVRRSSDNATQGFTPSEITDGTLTAFCGGGDGFINIRYDQSGNGNNEVWSVNVDQPQIVNTGTLLMDNGKPAPTYSTTTNTPGVISNIHGLARVDMFMVINRAANNMIVFDGQSGIGGGSFYGFIGQSGSTATNITSNFGTPNLYKNGVSFSGTNRGDIYTFLQTGNQILQSNINASTSAWSVFEIGGYAPSSFPFNGTLQELIIYDSDQSVNKDAIETEINSYYSIY